jgi:hypothetical protein
MVLLTIRRRLWLLALGLAPLLLFGCLPAQITRAPGAFGRVVDAETGQPVWRATIVREISAPAPRTNGTINLLRPFQAGDLGAVVYSGRNGFFAVPPARRLEFDFFLPGERLVQPDPVSAVFLVSSAGYATNWLQGAATKTNGWRVDLESIELHPIRSNHLPDKDGNCDCP